MSFIARLGVGLLALLVIFALFVVRYDTLRRRDTDSVSLIVYPQHIFGPETL